MTISVTPLGGALGAELGGVDLGDLTDSEFEAIQDAFYEYSMLAFPGQSLTPEEHVSFAGRWGSFSISPFVSYLDAHPCILALHNRGKTGAVTENWHTDSAFLATPPALNVLSAQEVPIGGDTMWCNQYRSYDRLSDALKAMLNGIRAEFTGTRLAALVGSDEVPSRCHPLIRAHPVTGRKALYISKPGDSVSRLEGMTEAESLPLLNYLYAHSTQPDNVYRHRWSNGDVVMWDNRCTMHYAVHDYGDSATRDIHRISIEGEEPRG